MCQCYIINSSKCTTLMRVADGGIGYVCVSMCDHCVPKTAVKNKFHSLKRKPLTQNSSQPEVCITL